MSDNITSKLTQDLIKKTKPKSNAFFIWDTAVRGFGCRIYPSGKKSFLVSYRNTSRILKRPVIGDCNIMPLPFARERARIMLLRVSEGHDPLSEKQADRNQPLMKDFAEQYIQQHAIPKKKPRSVTSDKSNLRLHVLPALGDIRVVDIARIDVQRLHNNMCNTPGAANHVIALLSKMMNLAEKWGIRPDGSNPCRHIEKYKERKLGRVIKPHELKALGNVLRNIEKEADPMRWNDAAARVSMVQAIRLLLFTGCRVGEIISLKWEYIDFSSRIAELPDSKTGAKLIYFSDNALSILKSIQPLAGNPYVFPGRHGVGHIARMGHLWMRIREEAGIADLRLHDLRHGFASVGVGMGESLPMVGQLLGHTQAQTTNRYAHLAARQTLDAANRIGNRIAEDFGSPQPSEKQNNLSQVTSNIRVSLSFETSIYPDHTQSFSHLKL